MAASLRTDAVRLHGATRSPAAHGRLPLRVLLILSVLMGFGSISTDLYLPALPTMATALRSTSGALDFTVSGYLVGFSLGQLLWGPIGDRHGRRGPVAVGLVLFVIGSAGCALSPNVSAMIGWRVLQAVGACAGVVLSRAMVRDLYTGDRAAQMLSTLLTVMAIAPMLGPILGAQILAFAGWRPIFWTLVGIGALSLVALCTLPETLQRERRNPESLARAFAHYAVLVRDRRLLAYAGSAGCFYAGTFAYIAGSPFAYIAYCHLPPRLYGLLFGAGIIGLMASNMANARLVTHVGRERLLETGNHIAALAGVILAIDAWTGWGGIGGLAAPLFCFVSATGLIVANAVAGALATHPERAGAVSALVGTIQYGGGIAGSALVGLLADGTPRPMGLVIAVAALGGLLSLRLRPAASA